MTTTVNAVFPDLVGAFPASAPIAYVDSPGDAPPGAVTYKHSSDAVRFRSFTGNMFEAVDLLETYRRDHSALVTSRLHCYLPMRSIGAKVDFRPKNRSDIRFAGLIDITDDQFDAIRTGINDRLEKVFAAIMGVVRPKRSTACGVSSARTMSRSPARAVLRHRPRSWSRLMSATSTADDRGQPDPRVDGPSRRRTRRDPGCREPIGPLTVLVESLVLQASRPLHIWLLDSSDEGVDLDVFARRAVGSTVTAIPSKGLSPTSGA